MREFTSSTDLRNLAGDKVAFDDFNIMVTNSDLTHRSQNPDENGVLEKYIPAIFVANVENADYTKQPIFSSGTYVNDQLPGVEEYQDYIVVWVADEWGSFNEILMNEETALKTSHPIFIIDNAEEEITKRAKSTPKFEVPKKAKNMETAWYSSYEYQINHRYDNSSKSEFCITGAQINENGIVELICNRGNETFDTWKKIAEVPKSKVGQLLYKWEQFCSNDVIPFDHNFIFWNTYERDWAKSEKYLGEATRNSTTIYLYGRRQFSGEWYAYDPGLVKDNPVDLNTIYWSWAKWHDNTKGKFRIWRIQP